MDDSLELIDGPWSDNVVDLREVKLTIKQKLWLGKIMAKRKRALKTLQDQYSLRTRVLWKYRRCYLDNIKMFPRGGRPRAIDDESVENIRHFVRSESPSKTQFEHVLIEEHASTVCRRRPGIDADEIIPLSKRSIGRYTTSLLILC
jgi:hypothetical protein